MERAGDAQCPSDHGQVMACSGPCWRRSRAPLLRSGAPPWPTGPDWGSVRAGNITAAPRKIAGPAEAIDNGQTTAGGCLTERFRQKTYRFCYQMGWSARRDTNSAVAWQPEMVLLRISRSRRRTPTRAGAALQDLGISKNAARSAIIMTASFHASRYRYSRACHWRRASKPQLPASGLSSAPWRSGGARHRLVVESRRRSRGRRHWEEAGARPCCRAQAGPGGRAGEARPGAQAEPGR